MQIEKINENQLQVTLNLDDLRKNNISLHSFMCNSIESQNLFFDILSFANKEIGFSINHYEVVIETFSVPVKSSFVLLFTRIPKVTHLHLSKTKYSTLKAHKSFWLKFNNFEDFCMFCSSIKNNLNIKSSLYLLNDCYFLHIRIAHLRDLIKFLLSASEFSDYIYGHNFVLDENAEVIICDYAIETSKNYFI